LGEDYKNGVLSDEEYLKQVKKIADPIKI